MATNDERKRRTQRPGMTPPPQASQKGGNAKSPMAGVDTSAPTGQESDEELAKRAERLQVAAAEASDPDTGTLGMTNQGQNQGGAGGQNQPRNGGLSQPPNQGQSPNQGGGEEGLGFGGYLDTALQMSPLSPAPQTVRKAGNSLSRIANYTQEGVEEADTTGMKIANAAGRPIGGGLYEFGSAVRDVGGELGGTAYNVGRGLAGATEREPQETQSGQTQQGQQGQQGQEGQQEQEGGEQASPVEERQFPNSDETYYANPETNTFAGTREGAQEGAMGGGGLSIMPTRNGGSLAPPPQAQQGGGGRMGGGDPGMAEAGQNATRRSQLRREAQDIPSIDQPLTEFLQNFGETRQAQKQLQSEQDMRAKVAEANRKSQSDWMDFRSDMASTQAEREGNRLRYRADMASEEGDEYAYETIERMTDEGMVQMPVRFNKQSGRMDLIDPNTGRVKEPDATPSEAENKELMANPGLLPDYLDKYGVTPEARKILQAMRENSVNG
ncbi:hypothetical protein [Thiohalorhabdus sp.]|uniref:hypothetical protein n=1 Tax=Thiohalorhabdus sp. TaxID=3094134 RepID=UPI002FC3C374